MEKKDDFEVFETKILPKTRNKETLNEKR